MEWLTESRYDVRTGLTQEVLSARGERLRAELAAICDQKRDVAAGSSDPGALGTFGGFLGILCGGVNVLQIAGRDPTMLNACIFLMSVVLFCGAVYIWCEWKRQDAYELSLREQAFRILKENEDLLPALARCEDPLYRDVVNLLRGK